MWKIVAGSVLLTTAVLVMAASLFLEGILGMVGMAYTSIEKLNDLKASQQVVRQLKQRHKIRRARASKRFVQRSGRKLASTAVAGATVGTAAVVLTVASMEIYDYCDEQKLLLQEENLLYGTDKRFDSATCLAEAKREMKGVTQALMAQAPVLMSEAWEEAKSISQEQWESVKQATAEIWHSAAQLPDRAWDALLHWNK